jgi:hypothetical protein
LDRVSLRSTRVVRGSSLVVRIFVLPPFLNFSVPDYRQLTPVNPVQLKKASSGKFKPHYFSKSDSRENE